MKYIDKNSRIHVNNELGPGLKIFFPIIFRAGDLDVRVVKTFVVVAFDTGFHFSDEHPARIAAQMGVEVGGNIEVYQIMRLTHAGHGINITVDVFVLDVAAFFPLPGIHPG